HSDRGARAACASTESSRGVRLMYVIATYYAFTPIEDPRAYRARCLERAGEIGLLGTILVASEGVNATVAAPTQRMHRWIDWLRAQSAFHDVPIKTSRASHPGFDRLSVRVRPELVALGVPGVDPREVVGTYVPPEEWDGLIAREDVLLVDCRNSFEVDVGTFDGAVDPDTNSFHEFPAYVDSLDVHEHKKIAMFCTGGIRCEKATSYMKARGFEEVYHLEGGILAYLERMGAQSQSWHGECFVFDKRVSVDKHLAQGSWEVCWGCRMPLRPQDRAAPGFEFGVTCGRCVADTSDDELERRRARLERLTTQGL
ncbi:MAG: rhodanese-related sulfurtransferase, partial [Myxococcota bacterium]